MPLFNEFVVKMEYKAHSIPKCSEGSIESFLICCQFCILCEIGLCRFHGNDPIIKTPKSNRNNKSLTLVLPRCFCNVIYQGTPLRIRCKTPHTYEWGTRVRYGSPLTIDTK